MRRHLGAILVEDRQVAAAVEEDPAPARARIGLDQLAAAACLPRICERSLDDAVEPQRYVEVGGVLKERRRYAVYVGRENVVVRT